MINIYVGNLPYKTSEADLAELFAGFGKVERASIVMDRQTGRSRGFGFVEMVDHAQGTQAIEALAGNDWNGRPLTINEARPRGSGTTGGDTGFSSSTTSFGDSAGYTNAVTDQHAPQPSKPAEPAAKPEADAELAQANDASSDPEAAESPPISRGYSNQMVQD